MMQPNLSTHKSQRTWAEIENNQNMRSTVNRLAIHGFHHKVCVTVTEECVCKLCSEKCPVLTRKKKKNKQMNYRTQL
ncbi:hypothetical protein C0J52_26696 [Blattella germanica]|nr:hypothetical protein C0J52_26696 [Blattella germanica]